MTGLRIGLADLIAPGDLLVAGQVLGEPTALLEEIFAADGLDGCRLFTGMSLTDVLERAPAGLGLLGFVGLGSAGRLLAAGRLDLVPCHMSDLPWAMTHGPLRPDVALVLVSPPDSQGMCSLGVEADYVWAAVNSARTVIAEVNSNVPRVAGDTCIPFDRIDAHLPTERPLPRYERPRPSGSERLIGARVAEFVRDGSCLQVGVGRLGEAVLEAVADRRDLGVHTGMVGETILELMRDGVITGARKPIDTGLTVTGSILGGSAAVELAGKEQSLRLRSVEHTNAAAVISALDGFVCVNSAIEVDLLGQVNAEVAGGRYVGGIGGSVDFLRASVRAPGGRSIVALPAAARGGISRIVPAVERVTVQRSDVDVVVTEHGVARLRGVSQGERARRLVQLAAPEHRERLLAAAEEMGL
jgi:acetyl-CoA hydrolase